ncbi:MAG: SRPBCC domain-containing protein [bacterium]
MIEPLVMRFEVPCSQQNAFEVFLDKMDTWWPLGKFTVSAMTGVPATTIRVDAREGGDIVEVGGDGTEVVWGTILTLDRYTRVTMDFHIPRPGDVVTRRPLLEMDFVPLSATQTRVILRQSNYEALGEIGASVRGGYEFGFKMIFEGNYRAACGG